LVFERVEMFSTFASILFGCREGLLVLTVDSLDDVVGNSLRRGRFS
jgi:hypothetical protein